MSFCGEDGSYSKKPTYVLEDKSPGVHCPKTEWCMSVGRYLLSGLRDGEIFDIIDKLEPLWDDGTIRKFSYTGPQPGYTTGAVLIFHPKGMQREKRILLGRFIVRHLGKELLYQEKGGFELLLQRGGVPFLQRSGDSRTIVL